MRLVKIMLMHCQSAVVYAIADFVVRCRGRRCIHHVPAKRDMISYNFASWIIVDIYGPVILIDFILAQSSKILA